MALGRRVSRLWHTGVISAGSKGGDIEYAGHHADRMMRAFLDDLRYARRGLRGRPGFMWIVLITLALGIGVNTAGFTAVLATIFGLLALLLAATGIYGVLNYQVSVRMPEMGIRMALGATVENIFSLIFREASWLAATGILLGIVGAQAEARLLASL